MMITTISKLFAESIKGMERLGEVLLLAAVAWLAVIIVIILTLYGISKFNKAASDVVTDSLRTPARKEIADKSSWGYNFPAILILLLNAWLYFFVLRDSRGSFGGELFPVVIPIFLLLVMPISVQIIMTAHKYRRQRNTVFRDTPEVAGFVGGSVGIDKSNLSFRFNYKSLIVLFALLIFIAPLLFLIYTRDPLVQLNNRVDALGWRPYTSSNFLPDQIFISPNSSIVQLDYFQIASGSTISVRQYMKADMESYFSPSDICSLEKAYELRTSDDKSNLRYPSPCKLETTASNNIGIYSEVTDINEKHRSELGLVLGDVVIISRLHDFGSLSREQKLEKNKTFLLEFLDGAIPLYNQNYKLF